jgi:hypothetical protein
MSTNRTLEEIKDICLNNSFKIAHKLYQIDLKTYVQYYPNLKKTYEARANKYETN